MGDWVADPHRDDRRPARHLAVLALSLGHRQVMTGFVLDAKLEADTIDVTAACHSAWCA
jgi:hypothetical protein